MAIITTKVKTGLFCNSV